MGQRSIPAGEFRQRFARNEIASFLKHWGGLSVQLLKGFPKSLQLLGGIVAEYDASALLAAGDGRADAELGLQTALKLLQFQTELLPGQPGGTFGGCSRFFAASSSRRRTL